MCRWIGGAIATGVVGGASGGPAPTYDSKTGRFSDGVRTDFRDFKPRYSKVIEERGNSYNDRPNYGPGPNYGGARSG